ncbi:MAG: PIN domain-containing protein [Acidobacteriaceae bacterium]|nr:PIN domain-containing protein [Acidobacteriaceae bacterium]
MIILADTSVWVDHFRDGCPELAQRLIKGEILMHPWIIGELAMGNLQGRETVLSFLRLLPSVAPAGDGEASQLIESKRLWGRGLGWIDVHLLASALLANCRLWTFDKRLCSAAGELGLN